jgi:hypothetical protein
MYTKMWPTFITEKIEENVLGYIRQNFTYWEIVYVG